MPAASKDPRTYAARATRRADAPHRCGGPPSASARTPAPKRRSRRRRRSARCRSRRGAAPEDRREYVGVAIRDPDDARFRAPHMIRKRATGASLFRISIWLYLLRRITFVRIDTSSTPGCRARYGRPRPGSLCGTIGLWWETKGQAGELDERRPAQTHDGAAAGRARPGRSRARSAARSPRGVLGVPSGRRGRRWAVGWLQGPTSSSSKPMIRIRGR
jgi:hypothetical protein